MSTFRWRPDELEDVLCDYCKTSDTRMLLLRADGMQVVECRSCGLTYLNPRPKPELVARLYEQDYFTKSTGQSVVGYADYTSPDNQRAQTQSAENKLKLLEPQWQPTGRICLEVGCATGEFCHVLKQHGAEVIGTDLSEFVINKARQYYPEVEFRVGGVESITAEHRFDAIFAFEVIEHVLKPSEFLLSARRLLKEGGILVLSTPNLDCGRRVNFERWSGFQISFEHLYFFDRGTLAKLGTATGFSLAVALTGGGSGVLATPENQPVRHRLRTALRKTGLLKLVRAIKRAFQPPRSPGYTKSLHDHNLIVVLEATSSGASAPG